MANGASTGGASGGGALAGLSDLLSGVGKFFEKNPEGAAHMLGQFGAAISPQGSWQERLGAAASQMSQNEQGRKFLAELLGEQKSGLPEASTQSTSLSDLTTLGEHPALTQRADNRISQVMSRPYK